jgi:hypothetical protein
MYHPEDVCMYFLLFIREYTTILSMVGLTVWVPGGTYVKDTRLEAIKLIRQYWSTRLKSIGWERRKAGVDSETSWEDMSYQHKTLRSAVTAAIPNWKEIGLTPEQAALVCFDAELVLSVGLDEEKEGP